MQKKLILYIFFLVASIQGIAQAVPYVQLDSLKMYTDLDKALANANEVFRLDLSKKKLKEIPSEVYSFTNLQELILNKNKIDSIPADISKLENLQILRISANKLKSIPTPIYELKNLIVLELSDMNVIGIPDRISELQNLQELILWGNIIGEYSGELANLPDLKVLDLLHNEMSVAEQEFLKSILSEVTLHLSDPCDCEFLD